MTVKLAPTITTTGVSLFSSQIPRKTTSSPFVFSTPISSTLNTKSYEKMVEQNSFLINVIVLLSGVIVIVVLSKMQIN